VAFLSVSIESHLTGMLSDITDFAYSSDLIVSEQYRRQGVGTALLATAQAYAARAGASHVVLRVLTANEAAMSAYRRFGFAEHDVRMIKSVRQVRSARAGLPVPATGAGAPRRSRAQPAQRVPRSRPAPRV
jgi:ribosomal protein S18 acetylase RimI-like enzyme